jgi:hypothetical protein
MTEATLVDFSLASFPAWARTQSGPFSYSDPKRCPLMQYAIQHGYRGLWQDLIDTNPDALRIDTMVLRATEVNDERYSVLIEYLEGELA